jgi:imidazole glycerol-phosphate synthase subunit HisH
MKVGIINYGAGNIGNVSKSLKALNINYKIINKPSDFNEIDKIILPGQGAFASAIENLQASGVYEKIAEFSNDQKPILAICLGMQLLFSVSSEFGYCQGLNLIDGEVKKLNIGKMPLPIIGWYKIFDPKNINDNPVFNRDFLNYYYYFAHSMHCLFEEKNTHCSYVNYNGVDIVATISKNNIFATQFHPELSHKKGLDIINNFLNL